jgi:hypothetical protein
VLRRPVESALWLPVHVRPDADWHVRPSTPGRGTRLSVRRLLQILAAMGASALVRVVPMRMAHRNRPFLATLVLGVTMVLACGDPVTQVYVANLDDAEYCVIFVEGSGPADQISVLLGPGAQGLIVSTTGEAAGIVELRRRAQPVAQRVRITPGRSNLIEIVGGTMRLDDRADLSGRSGGSLDGSPSC